MDNREKGRGLHKRSKRMQPLLGGKTLHHESTPKKPQQKIRDHLKMQTQEQISLLKDKPYEDNSDESSNPRKPWRKWTEKKESMNRRCLCCLKIAST